MIADPRPSVGSPVLMGSIAPAIALLTLMLLGCASLSEPDRLAATTRPDIQAHSELLNNLKSFQTSLQQDEPAFQQTTEVAASTVNEGVVEEWSHEFRAGRPVAVIGGCDSDCHNLKLAILDAAGNLAAQDLEADGIPKTVFIPGRTDSYTIRITMSSCAQNPCHYAFQVLEQPGSATTDVRAALSQFVEGVVERAEENGTPMSPDYEPVIDLLNAGAVEHYKLDLKIGESVVVIGLCDDNCTDLDLSATDPGGETIAIDVEDDDAPYIFVDPPVSGSYELHVGMPRCGSSSCAFGLQAFAVTVDASQANGGSGTCFAARPDGLLLTADHVIADSGNISVRLSDGRVLAARVAARSPQNDIAALRVEASTPDYLTLADMRGTQLGDRVFTIGFPVPDVFDGNPTFAEGAVGSLNLTGGEANGLHISIPIQPGNSGGPVVNLRGEVVGIVTASESEESFYSTYDVLPQSINWAVKSDFARPMFDAPRALTPAVDRGAAIDRARKAVCYVETSGSATAPADALDE